MDEAPLAPSAYDERREAAKARREQAEEARKQALLRRQAQREGGGGGGGGGGCGGVGGHEAEVERLLAAIQSAEEEGASEATRVGLLRQLSRHRAASLREDRKREQAEREALREAQLQQATQQPAQLDAQTAVLISVTCVLLFGEILPSALMTGQHQLRIGAALKVGGAAVGRTLALVGGEEGAAQRERAAGRERQRRKRRLR